MIQPNTVGIRAVVGGGYDEFWRCRKRYRVVKGGKASKKSTTAALWFIVNLMKPKYRQANLLVGNPRDTAALECQLLGPTLRFEGDAAVAVTGADMRPKLDGQPVPMWQTLHVRAGQVLEIGAAYSGARGYVAVAGGIDTPVVLSALITAVGNLGATDNQWLSKTRGPLLVAGTTAIAALLGFVAKGAAPRDRG